MGFSFTPMLSGESSSGEMHDGLRGLRGLQPSCDGLYSPYPMRKYSIGISIACGCSSVTIDPHAWTWNPKSDPPLKEEIHDFMTFQWVQSKYHNIFTRFHAIQLIFLKLPQPKRYISYPALRSCGGPRNGTESSRQRRLAFGTAVSSVILSSHASW